MTKTSNSKKTELRRKKKAQASRPFRKGERLMVLSGKSQGKYGSFVSLSKKDRVIVEGINMSVHHIKDRNDGTAKTGRVEKENPIHVSNVALACPHCARPTRPRTKVRVYEEDGVRKKEKTRYCHRCGELIPLPGKK